MRSKENRCTNGENPEPAGSGKMTPFVSAPSFYKVSQHFLSLVQMVVVCGIISSVIITLVIISPV